MTVNLLRATIRLRRATSAEFAAKNAIYMDGEPLWETDAKRQKIGDGVTSYNDLPYYPADSAVGVSLQDLEDHINSDTPHPVYDDGPSLLLLYQNAKV